MSSHNLSLVRSVQNTLRLTLAYASPAAARSLRLLPGLVRVIAYLLLILNFRSLPFGWHGRPVLAFSCNTTLISLYRSHLILAGHQGEMACMVCPHAHALPFLRGP